VLAEDEKAADALAALSGGATGNRALVVENGDLVGLLSITDLARALEIARWRRPRMAPV
jgi:CBS domain-containing protein